MSQSNIEHHTDTFMCNPPIGLHAMADTNPGTTVRIGEQLIRVVSTDDGFDAWTIPDGPYLKLHCTDYGAIIMPDDDHAISETQAAWNTDDDLLGTLDQHGSKKSHEIANELDLDGHAYIGGAVLIDEWPEEPEAESDSEPVTVELDETQVNVEYNALADTVTVEEQEDTDILYIRGTDNVEYGCQLPLNADYEYKPDKEIIYFNEKDDVSDLEHWDASSRDNVFDSGAHVWYLEIVYE
jgi:hypothetical protein